MVLRVDRFVLEPTVARFARSAARRLTCVRVHEHRAIRSSTSIEPVSMTAIASTDCWVLIPMENTEL